MTEIELAWLAGLMEGEGNFRCSIPKNRPHSRTLVMQINMTDRDIIERVHALIGSTGVYVRQAIPARNKRESYSTALTGLPSAEIMKQILPFMGHRRAQQIRSSLAEWDSRPLKLRHRKKTADCHPDRPHKGNGLCEQCHRHMRYSAKDLPKRAAVRVAKKRDVLFV